MSAIIVSHLKSSRTRSVFAKWDGIEHFDLRLLNAIIDVNHVTSDRSIFRSNYPLRMRQFQGKTQQQTRAAAQKMHSRVVVRPPSGVILIIEMS